ncbi:MAG: 2-nitropropane dioxygenase [Candidatus Muproteobacteria bacterium RIFCSPHIGHO2_12_FULL_60_33]|uniref:2-nitropropane dioxygenase n=1 Tax=Candidatus Muproteobacteria bacterium RIFCSPLOWO2_01_FULL_60_18 TaxID=1817768 RepID=A0A1F6TYA7_9PROT|nr:MAG: 2-nitropropane dioxygenase [Candidatus Muproteobacteria bacterium RIFCSPHIGHO2_01_60_12]OGI50049.1 MAG: 2-nitropropane dioxygenase [Candidatus Muproteobacteria bacterium RIFCSPLOWO2_01_FULL_60_18]OGI55100.1 MAG: 2-nitropropane dioxygenase [Candidatus Muproteobacteria bacterium RIFCSPHIGHO2_12_FULL_60_33]OGI56908.1 MAG: 2-nitropropane dioxygenase [Candidatus Muproteobacteria bacterium RIFCSPHIGHO2_02_FULL_60_13]
MKRVDDFRLKLGKKELVPIMTGGMGVDISTAELSLVSARLGGIGHISDAMVPTISDRRFKTRFVKEKQKKYKYNVANVDKSVVQFDLGRLAEATKLHVGRTMEARKGDGLIFINTMEKLTMNSPRETLRVRLASAMDGGIDGITLSAGLHLGSLALVQDHPRFRDVKFGIIVSSLRALLLFLRKNARLNRLPDYIVVEGPLAGGHLGFGMDWAQYDLKTIVNEIHRYLKQEGLNIPVIPAGGIFTGSDAVEFLEAGAAAVQVATRFTVTKECGLPDKVKQEYFKAKEDDIEVNLISPTGYPMRMLKNSPAIGAGIRPNCEAYGYLLDGSGNCAYIEAYNRELEKHPDEENISVKDKTCLCTHMRNFDCWTCGHYTYRLKDTSRRLPDGTYQLLTAEHVFRDYLYSTEHRIALPVA